MLILGIVLLLFGYFLEIHVLWVIGVILVVVGAVLLLVDVVGHQQIGGRRWY